MLDLQSGEAEPPGSSRASTDRPDELERPASGIVTTTSLGNLEAADKRTQPPSPPRGSYRNCACHPKSMSENRLASVAPGERNRSISFIEETKLGKPFPHFRARHIDVLPRLLQSRVPKDRLDSRRRNSHR
jgi:hypothetical protein